MRLDIGFYNTKEQRLFQGFPNAIILNNVVRSGINISKDEFLAYMMFMDQDDGSEGYTSYEELRLLISSRFGDLNNYISYDNNSIQSRVSPERMHSARFTERIGISLGLCLVNRLHNLTAADWKKIPETKKSTTFDFEIQVASTGNNFIQVENKGCIVHDNSYKTPGVSGHYSRIKDKKDVVRNEEKRQQIPIHQNFFYGTIGVLDILPNSVARVWLVDPPAFEIEIEPKKYKLLARLRFYLDEFRKIGVKRKITESLEKRLKEIESSDNYYQYNFKKIDEKFPSSSGVYYYMESKECAILDTNEAFGRIFLIEDYDGKIPYLIAFPKVIMRLIVKQDFESILNYEYKPTHLNEAIQVLMRFKESDTKELNFSKKMSQIFNEKIKLFEVVYYGLVSYTTDGRIFGELKG